MLESNSQSPNIHTHSPKSTRAHQLLVSNLQTNWSHIKTNYKRTLQNKDDQQYALQLPIHQNIPTFRFSLITMQKLED